MILANHMAFDGNQIQIIVPKCLGRVYTTDLNASIVQHNGFYYIAYRADKKPWLILPVIVFAKYDIETNTSYDDKYLYLENQCFNRCIEFHRLPAPELRAEDPRLFSYNDKLMMNFTDGFNMYVCQIDLATFRATDIKILKPPTMYKTLNSDADGRQKNWTPFISRNKVNYVYSFNPFVVLDDKSNVLVKKNYDLSFYTKKYGNIRGGTPSLPYKDGYLCFTHSVFTDRGKKTYGISCAYHTDKQLIAIGRNLLIMGDDYCLDEEDPDKPDTPCGTARVVFASGAVKTDTGYKVSYGVNDRMNYCMDISDEEIEWSLEEVMASDMQQIILFNSVYDN
jgi:predicted GH43/DUF377 family glycosyl hydrolase